MKALPALALLVAAGCNSAGDRYVVVTVDSPVMVRGVATLRTQATAGGRMSSFDLHPQGTAKTVDIPPPTTFAIDVPRAIGGLIALHVEALDTGGAVLGVGDGEGTLGGDRVDVVVTLGQTADGGVYDLSATADAHVGDGGTVTADGASSDGASSDGATGDLGVVAPPDLSPPLCPNIMLMVDYTGSTGGAVTGAASELDAEKAAVVMAANKYAATVPLGLTTFAVATACNSGVAINVEPALNTAAAITSALNALATNGGGNNDVALEMVSSDTLFTARQPSYMIMLTDNAPNCDGVLVDGGLRDIVAAIHAAAGSFAAGYPVLVIGLPLINAPDTANLDAIAAAGGMACSGCGGHSYYPTDTASSIATTLDGLIGGLTAGCHN